MSGCYDYPLWPGFISASNFKSLSLTMKGSGNKPDVSGTHSVLVELSLHPGPGISAKLPHCVQLSSLFLQQDLCCAPFRHLESRRTHIDI